MKVTASICVFNSDFVLSQVIESLYPYVDRIAVAEGPVSYWQSQGYTTSTDRTNEILHSFPDPQNKIRIHHGQYPEKTDQCQAYMQFVDQDTDYLFAVDADELYFPEHMEALLKIMDSRLYNSISLHSATFFGGFGHILSGFEWGAPFKRILRHYPGSVYTEHRPPTLRHPAGIQVRPDMSHDQLYDGCGVSIFHVSYVFPRQVKEKVQYYKASVSRDACIDDYYKNVWYPWAIGFGWERLEIESKYRGVHEFKPEVRGDCFPVPYHGSMHPLILRDMEVLDKEWQKQIKELKP